MVKSAVSGESLEVTVYPTKGGYTGFEPVKSTEFRINVTERPSRISVRVGYHGKQYSTECKRIRFLAC